MLRGRYIFTPVCLFTAGGLASQHDGGGVCGQILPEPDKGRYASYWNAFLFLVNSNHTNSQWLWKSSPFNAINVTLAIFVQSTSEHLSPIKLDLKL